MPTHNRGTLCLARCYAVPDVGCQHVLLDESYDNGLSIVGRINHRNDLSKKFLRKYHRPISQEKVPRTFLEENATLVVMS